MVHKGAAAVPPNVALFIGVPAYHDERVRLALGARQPARDVGVAMHVDFAATPEDWDTYHRDWDDVA